MSEGHTYARHYPLVMVWHESKIVEERVNQRIATETIGFRAAAISMMATDEAGQVPLKDFLKRLKNGR